MSLCLYCHPARVESTPDCRATSQLPEHTSVQRLTALYRHAKPSRLCHFFPLPFQCCFTSTGTIRLVRDREPRTSTSTFTLLLSCAVAIIDCVYVSVYILVWVNGVCLRVEILLYAKYLLFWLHRSHPLLILLSLPHCQQLGAEQVEQTNKHLLGCAICVCIIIVKSLQRYSYNLKENEAESACADSTNKGS